MREAVRERMVIRNGAGAAPVLHTALDQDAAELQTLRRELRPDVLQPQGPAAERRRRALRVSFFNRYFLHRRYCPSTT